MSVSAPEEYRTRRNQRRSRGDLLSDLMLSLFRVVALEYLPGFLARLRGPLVSSSLVFPRSSSRRIVRRMPRMQVYLPDDLYRQVKERSLPASELLQEAVRAELHRQELLEQTDTYLAELIAEVGEPSARELARAEAIARRIRDHHAQQAS